jgi:hypothetical protein
MTITYAFNGDADGLCALQQLRLDDATEAVLVTGVKRDIRLLRRVEAGDGDEVTVLDISLADNRDDLARLLDAGASVRYFDHHHAGPLPHHPRFAAHIDESPEVCTSILVDRFLGGRCRPWAIVAAFGDNLPAVGRAMAEVAGYGARSIATLEQLGIRLNYNAYGDTVDDLCFDPAELAAAMLPFADPLAFAKQSPAYDRLGTQYDDDMRRARALEHRVALPGARLVVLPDEPWARRAIGVLANDLTHAHPGCAIAILAPNARGNYTVSLRVPEASPVAADEFCRGFPTGGGRKRAAGINELPIADVDRLASAFAAQFRIGT